MCLKRLLLNEPEYKIGLSVISKGFLFTLLELFGILREEYMCNNILVSIILVWSIISVPFWMSFYEQGLLNFLKVFYTRAYCRACEYEDMKKLLCIWMAGLCVKANHTIQAKQDEHGVMNVSISWFWH